VAIILMHLLNGLRILPRQNNLLDFPVSINISQKKCTSRLTNPDSAQSGLKTSFLRSSITCDEITKKAIHITGKQQGSVIHATLTIIEQLPTELTKYSITKNH
jgi:hypothetical protein